MALFLGVSDNSNLRYPSNLPRKAGAREHAYFLKEIPDARRLRVAIIDALERASLPVWTDEKRRTMLHFVIVGGGPTGCEFAGELADFVGADLSSKYEKDIISMIQVTLLQSGDSLLTQFEESLQKMAVSNFHSRVNIEFNARVVSVNANKLELADGRTIDYGLLVWAAGNATRPIVAKIIEKVTGVQKEEATKKRRKLTVDPWLRVKGATNVFALGDCATIDGESLPATAQVAGQQGAYIGRLVSKAININGKDAPVLRDAEDKEVSPFHFLSLGAMAYLGNDRAVVQVDASDSRQLAFGGRIAFFLWRSVYAVKQVDVRNRVLVLFDWFKARAFGRDSTSIPILVCPEDILIRRFFQLSSVWMAACGVQIRSLYILILTVNLCLCLCLLP
jgi:NADH:ubiquinone reductase (non-electrogenic)